jgi:VWFA-related protein
MTNRVITIVSFLVLIFCGFGAWSAQAAGQTEKGTAAPRKIVLDVVALKDGKPAGDLTASDFEIYEDGRKIPVRSSVYVQDPSPKQLIVVFHDTNVWIKNVQRDKDEITDQLIELVKRGIELEVMHLSWQKGLKILQSFTRDEALIRKASVSAIQKEGLNESFEALGGLSSDAVGIESAMRSDQENLLRSFDFMKRQRFEKAVGGLVAACNALKSFSGRKCILLVSAGIPDISSSSRTDILRSGSGGAETLDAIHERAQQSPGRTRLFDPFGILKGESFERGDQVLDRLVQYSNTENISIYALDPGVFTKSILLVSPEFSRPEITESESIQSEERAKEIQNLRQISEGTSGRLFRGANKFEDLLKTIVPDLEGYYELAFQPQGLKPDGKYHEIVVKTARRSIGLNYRKGFRDYTPEEAKNMLLISAYYSPELFDSLPFGAQFVPFVADSGKFESWISLAFPVKPLFIDRAPALPATTFSLYVWLREREEEEKGFATRIDIPIRMTDPLRESLPTMSHIWSFFKGPEYAFKNTAYDVVYVLLDSRTGELGGWSSILSVPDLHKNDHAAVVSCVLGSIAPNPQARGGTLSLNPKNGVLEFGQTLFYPQVTSAFSLDQDACAFFQIYLPLRKEKDRVSPQFMAFREGTPPQALAGKIVVESWNVKTKIWSGIFQLGLGSLPPGDHILKIAIPLWTEGSDLVTQTRLIKLDYSP